MQRSGEQEMTLRVKKEPREQSPEEGPSETAGPSEELVPGHVPVWLGWNPPFLTGGVGSMGEFPKAGPSAAAAPSTLGILCGFGAQ